MDEIVTTYMGRFAALGPTNHYSHGHVVRFDDEDPDVAYGLLASHAEVTRNGVGMVVALRYKDTYRRDAGQWKFQDRLMSYMYYLPIAEYADGLGDGAGAFVPTGTVGPRTGRVAPERRQAQRLAVGLPRLSDVHLSGTMSGGRGSPAAPAGSECPSECASERARCRLDSQHVRPDAL